MAVPDPTSLSKGKILVVDDDRLVLATVTHGLVQAGFEVIDADNGDDAILLARQHRPDLALLDIRMEGKSGFDVADYLRESLGTPFMFLSAFADAATVARVKELGAVAYLVKPLDIAQIVPTVEAAVAAVRARRERESHAPVARPLPTAPATGATPAPLAPASRPVDPLNDPVPLAVGVLMHRYSLPRAEALQRLTRLAQTDGRSLAAQAAALVDAVELLARPGQA
ncbi:response regulator [Ideonella dechloratans]|uniref:Response regulator n=1 Tax=Ideonella dechloratans TaxID=36863 RepID=A0A643FBE4_IDEDE|nr:response regulator [Ideonella dechloratans]KAB0581075.1 response regulator [Ideonella dechloratans]UFU09194.1 response regulator [Ideonella dechloratans]